jgi:hypothetical protein
MDSIKEDAMTFEQTKKIRYLINHSSEHGGLISMYIPITYPDGDPELVFKSLWRDAMKLRDEKNEKPIKAPVIPWSLFNKQMKRAVAIFISPAGHVIYALEDSVPLRLVVATSFHLKPLIASYSKNYSRRLLDKALENDQLYKVSEKDDFEVIKQKIKAKSFKTLIVSLDDMLFQEGGGIKNISSYQKNHRDDDVLDDLVELAIQQRIKVGVVPKQYLPNESCLLAC